MEISTNENQTAQFEAEEVDFDELMDAPEGTLGQSSSWGFFLHTQFQYDGAILDW